MKIGKTTAQLAHIQLREHASLNKSDTYATMTPRGEWWFKIILYKIGFESSLTFIFTKLWAKNLVNGKEWWLTRLTPNSANDAACSGTLGFSNESRERKLRRENPKKIYMDYWKIRNTRATRCRPPLLQPVTICHYYQSIINHLGSTHTKFRASYARSSIRTFASRFVTAQDIVQVCLRTKL